MMLALATESERLAGMARRLVDEESLAAPATHGLAMITVALLAQVLGEVDEQFEQARLEPRAPER